MRKVLFKFLLVLERFFYRLGEWWPHGRFITPRTLKLLNFFHFLCNELWGLTWCFRSYISDNFYYIEHDDILIRATPENLEKMCLKYLGLDLKDLPENDYEPTPYPNVCASLQEDDNLPSPNQ